jgi:ribonuclease E
MLVYEEGSLVKRSIRDLYNKEIDEIIVAGQEGHTDARDFMRMLMPSHAKNVKRYTDTLPIFTRFGIESQLDAMFQPVMQLRSGGYIVINQTEALVAIDVNSGRATREHHIEDTAVKTNVEAAEEIARQLRLRDLAGLIVIDFIDMDEKRNNRAVERKLKECLRYDRARIQVGHISHFGLLEMSRQRIRSSVLESSTEKCPTCGGTGHMRSVSSVALQLLRSIDEMLLKGATHSLMVRTRTEIALYLLNHKRAHLRSLEERFRIVITVDADATIGGQVSFLIEKGEQVHSLEQAKALLAQSPVVEEPKEDEADIPEFEEPEDREEVSQDEEVLEADGEPMSAPAEETAEGENGQARGKRRRRRGRRGGERRDEDAQVAGAPAQEPAVSDEDDEEASPSLEAEPDEAHAGSSEANGEANGEGERRRRRRGRRGGRRNRREREGGEANGSAENGHAHEPELASDSAEVDDQPITEPAHDEPAHDEPENSEPAHGEPTRSEPIHDEAPLAHHRQHVAEHREDEIPAKAVEQIAPPPPAPPPAEAPRRRSTVREPAPTAFTGESVMPIPMPVVPPEPIPQPVITTVSEDSDRPRRSGWWSKRTLGKD